jgi:hypothetical protein
MAPASAPTGPSTSAPDKAPSAASPVRSWAVATEDISAKEIVTIAIVFFIQDPPDGAPPCFHTQSTVPLMVFSRGVLAASPRPAFVGRRLQAAAPIDRPAFAHRAKYRAAHQIGLFLPEFELLARPVAQRVG